MLEEAKKYCEYLLVGLHTDPTVDRPEKNKPVQSVEERIVQLRACKFVDGIVLYETEKELHTLLEVIKPNVRIVGADWRGKHFTGDDLPIQVIFNSRNHNYSSSELRKRVCEK